MKGKFEDIIQKKFEGANSTVPANAWAGVSSGMAGSAAGSVFSSVVVKSIIGLAVAGSVITAVVINQLDSKPQNTAPALTETQNQEPVTAEPLRVLEQEGKKEEVSGSTELKPTAAPIITAQQPTTNQASEESKTEPTDIKASAEADAQNPNSTDLTDHQVSAAETDFTETAISNEPVEAVQEVSNQEIAAPSAIGFRSTGDYSYAFSLDQELGDLRTVKWYVEDALVNGMNELEYLFDASGEHSVMALIYKEGELEKTLFKTITIEAVASIKVPNTFTPHTSLGVNDVFDIDHEFSENIEDYQIEVYSVNGELIFKSTENTKAWNGQHNGSPAAEGVYVYKIIYWSSNGSHKSESGNVVLQR